MLTKTLRQLERDGLVTRRVHPTVPPQVDYRLTAAGENLSYAVCGVWIWVEKHVRCRRGRAPLVRRPQRADGCGAAA